MPLAPRCLDVATIGPFVARLTLGLIVLLVFLSPAEALAGPTWPSEKMFEAAMKWFEEIARRINQNLSGSSAAGFATSWAAGIFITCALIQSAVFFTSILLKRRQGGDVTDLLKRMTRYFIFVFVCWGILTFEGDITTTLGDALILRLAPEINTFAGKTAGYVTNADGSYSPTNPAEVVKAGWRTSNLMLKNSVFIWKSPELASADSSSVTTSGWQSLNPANWPAAIADAVVDAVPTIANFATILFSPDIILLLLIYCLTVFSFYAISMIALVAYITYIMATGFAPIFLAFLPLRIAAPVVTGYIRFYLYALIKLFAIYIFLPVMTILPEVALSIMTGTSTLAVSAWMDWAETLSSVVFDPTELDVTTGESDVPLGNIRARMDAIFMTGGFAVCAAAVVKTVPSRFAEIVTGGFSLDPLWDIYD